MDFIPDRTENGRPMKLLSVIDGDAHLPQLGLHCQTTIRNGTERELSRRFSGVTQKVARYSTRRFENPNGNFTTLPRGILAVGMPPGRQQAFSVRALENSKDMVIDAWNCLDEAHRTQVFRHVAKAVAT